MGSYSLRRILLFLIFISISFLAAAQSIDKPGNTLSLGALAGLLAGHSEEIVYRQYPDDMLSQLIWEMKPLTYLGVELGYRWQSRISRKNIFVDASFKFGLSDITGAMEDRDWTASSISTWLTHYSVHNNTTKEAYLADARIGWSFNPFRGILEEHPEYENFRIKPYIAYSFKYFSWAASGGSVLHPDWQEPLLKSFAYITYKQIWHSASLGASLYGKFNQYFDIKFFLELGPVWCTAYDEHFYYSTEKLAKSTTDTMHGISVQTAMLFSFKTNESITLAFSLGYRFHNVWGDLLQEKPGSPPEEVKNSSGAKYSFFDIGISFKFNLF
jgi:outer membrane protease